MENPQGNQHSQIPTPFDPNDDKQLLRALTHLSRSLSSKIFPVYNTYLNDPWKLPGDRTKKRIFLSSREIMTSEGVAFAPNGYWEFSAINDEQVLDDGVLLGMKRTLEFHNLLGSKTRWVMHQFYLIYSNQFTFVPRGDWILSRVYEKEEPLPDRPADPLDDRTLALHKRRKTN